MNLRDAVASRFATSRPTEAASLLETLPEAAVRDFIDHTELDAAARVIEAMLPSVAARCLASSSPHRASEILAALPLDRASDLMRRLDGELRRRLLESCPVGTKGPLERILKFPEQTAGAMMEPRVDSFRDSATAEATLAALRRPGGEPRYYVYAVDEALVLKGVTSLRELVAAPPEAPLRAFMTSPAETLSSRAGRAAIVNHPGWKRFPVLPVVDEHDRLVGVFRYETLQRLHQLPDAEDSSVMNVALALSELFWLGASGMVRGFETSTAHEEEASDE